MFGRKKDAEGLYTGDAPVSAPGFDGAEPTAYDGAHSVTAQPTSQIVPIESPTPAGVPPTTMPPAPGVVASGMPPAPGFGPSGMPPAPGFGTSSMSVTGGIPSDADLVRLEQLVAQKVPPQFAGKAMEQIERLRAQGGAQLVQGGPTGGPYSGGPYGAGPSYPGGPMLIPGRSRTPGRGGMVGCLVGVIVLAAIIAGVAFFIVDKVRDSTTAAFGPDNPAAGEIGVPATATYDDATLSLTVGKAVLQPGDPWGLSSANDDPVLLVDVDMVRTDDGTDPVTVIGWDWSFTPSGGGKSVTGDIIADYEPDLAGPKLSAGDSAHGWVSFDTSATSGTLGFSDSAAVRPAVTWSITATKPATVTGTLGKPARGEISAPSFTVTITNPHPVAATSTAVQITPDSGHYLAITAAVQVDADAGPFGGDIDDDTFVFTPTGGKPVPTSGFALADSLSYTSIEPGKKVTGVLAFDTAATAGTLTMRDGAGHAVITWSISAAPATSKPATSKPATSGPAPSGRTTAHPSTAPATRKTG